MEAAFQVLQVRDPRAEREVRVVPARCGPAQRAEQAGLFNRCFKKRVDGDALGWRYDRNPHGPAISLVSRPEGEEAVSGYACSPRRALVRGDEGTLAVAGETGDVMTDPSWRKRGLFSALDRAAMAEAARAGWALSFGLPNRRSAHIFVELGWEEIGRVRSWTHVLRADARARAAQGADGRLAALLVPLDRLAGRSARRRLARRGPGIVARPLLGSFPQGILEVAREVEPRFGFMVRRDPRDLTWRFLESPSGLHRCLALEGGGGRLEGFVAVQVPAEGEGRGYLVDLLARDERGVAAGIAAGLELLEREGASVARATALAGSWWEGWLARAGFRPAAATSELSVILWPHRRDHPLVAAARRTSEWYFTDGDRDDETMG